MAQAPYIELHFLQKALLEIVFHPNSSTRIYISFWLDTVNIVTHLVSNVFKSGSIPKDYGEVRQPDPHKGNIDLHIWIKV
jgi:hypothetical protein